MSDLRDRQRELQTEVRRGIVLRIIFDQDTFGVDERSIIFGLENPDIRPLVGEDIGTAVVRDDLAWLERLRLVTQVTTRTGSISTITARGQDVVLGRERVPGLKRWVG